MCSKWVDLSRLVNRNSDILGGISGDELDEIWPASNRPLMIQSAKLNLFDFVTGNMDRHSGNMLWNPKSKNLVAIDHGLAFDRVGLTPRSMETVYFGELQDSISTLSAEDKAQFKKSIQRLLRHRETVMALKGPEPDFRALTKEAKMRESISMGAVFDRAQYLLEKL